MVTATDQYVPVYHFFILTVSSGGSVESRNTSYTASH